MKIKTKRITSWTLAMIIIFSCFSTLIFALDIGVNDGIVIKMDDTEGSKSYYQTTESMATGIGIRYKLTGYTIHTQPHPTGDPTTYISNSDNLLSQSDRDYQYGSIDGITVKQVLIDGKWVDKDNTGANKDIAHWEITYDDIEDVLKSMDSLDLSQHEFFYVSGVYDTYYFDGDHDNDTTIDGNLNSYDEILNAEYWDLSGGDPFEQWFNIPVEFMPQQEQIIVEIYDVDTNEKLSSEYLKVSGESYWYPSDSANLDVDMDSFNEEYSPRIFDSGIYCAILDESKEQEFTDDDITLNSVYVGGGLLKLYYQTPIDDTGGDGGSGGSGGSGGDGGGEEENELSISVDGTASPNLAKANGASSINVTVSVESELFYIEEREVASYKLEVNDKEFIFTDGEIEVEHDFKMSIDTSKYQEKDDEGEYTFNGFITEDWDIKATATFTDGTVISKSTTDETRVVRGFEPPVVNLYMEDTVKLGDSVSMYTSASSPNGFDIDNYYWEIDSANRTEFDDVKDINDYFFTTEGSHDVSVVVIDSNNMGGSDEDTIMVLPPTVDSRITTTGELKEYRKISISSLGSHSPEKYPIVEGKTLWTKSPSENIISNQSASTSRSFDITVNDAIDIELALYLENTLGKNDWALKNLTIVEDQPPVADFTMLSKVYRNPIYSNYAIVNIQNTSSSPDGDAIANLKGYYTYDSNNDGIYDETKVKFYEGININNLSFSSDKVGKYKVELEVTETYDTLEGYEDQVPYLSNITLDERIVEIDNQAPTMDMTVLNLIPVTLDFQLGEYDMTLETLDDYINSDLTPTLQANGYELEDYNIYEGKNSDALLSLESSDRVLPNSTHYDDAIVRISNNDNRTILFISDDFYQNTTYEFKDENFEKIIQFDTINSKLSYNINLEAVRDYGYIVKNSSFNGYGAFDWDGNLLVSINLDSQSDTKYTLKTWGYSTEDYAQKTLDGTYKNKGSGIVRSTSRDMTEFLTDNDNPSIFNNGNTEWIHKTDYYYVDEHNSSGVTYKYNNFVVRNEYTDEETYVDYHLATEKDGSNSTEKYYDKSMGTLNYKDNEVFIVKFDGNGRYSEYSGSIFLEHYKFQSMINKNVNESDSNYFVYLDDTIETDAEILDLDDYKNQLTNTLISNSKKLITVGIIDSEYSEITENTEGFISTDLDDFKTNLINNLDAEYKDSLTNDFTFLLNSKIEFEEMYIDYENDPRYQGRFKIDHTDPNYYENSLGTISNNGSYTILDDDSELVLNKTGKFILEPQVQDKPIDDINFYDYYKWSEGDVENTILVHRKPVADFEIEFYKELLVTTNNSYDLDHESETNKGIVISKWKYQKEGQTWTEGLPLDSEIEALTNYTFALKVKDIEGVWSDWTLKELNSGVLTEKPILLEGKLKTAKNPPNKGGEAVFEENSDQTKFSKYSVPASESLVLYDIKTEYRNDVKLEISIENLSGTRVSSIKNVDFTELTGRKSIVDGMQVINWKDVIYQIPDTLPDGNYNINITAIDTLDTTQTATVLLSFAVKTPIDLESELTEIKGNKENIITAISSIYTSSLKLELFKDTEESISLDMEEVANDGERKTWQVIYENEAPIENGFYKGEFIGKTSNGNIETLVKDFEMKSLEITEVTLTGGWNHWRGQIDMFGTQLEENPMRFLSYEMLFIDVKIEGEADEVSIRMSSPLESMMFIDIYGNIIRYEEELGYEVKFPVKMEKIEENPPNKGGEAVFEENSEENPPNKEAEIWRYEYILPVAPSTINWYDLREENSYWIEITAKKENSKDNEVDEAVKRVEGIELTGNIYDLLFFQPKQ